MFHRVLNAAVTTKTFIELPQKALMSPAIKHESVTGVLWGLWNMKKQKKKIRENISCWKPRIFFGCLEYFALEWFVKWECLADH